MDESTLSGSNNSNSLGNSQTTGMSYGTGPGSIAASSAAMSSSIVAESGIAFSAEVAGNLGGSGPKISSGQKIAQYTFPGVLHFLQNEWTKVELERSQWEIDKAELQAKIAFLQGERRGQDNLKGDLIRRIKMLEFTLKQERDKFNKMKNGTEVKQGETRPLSDDQATGVSTETVLSASSVVRNAQETGSGSNVSLNAAIAAADTKTGATCAAEDAATDTKTNDASQQPDQMNETIIFLEKPQIKEDEVTSSPADHKNEKEHYFDSDNDFGISSLTWKQGRQILRQYLKEIGCTDTILDLRSSKIKDLLRNNYTNEQRIMEENKSNTAYKTNMQNYENNKKTGNLKERMTQFYPFFNAHNILINDPNDESDNVPNAGGAVSMSENNSSRSRGELILDPMDSYNNYRDRDRDRERCQNLDGDMDIEEDDIDAQAQQVYDELTLMSAWEKMSQNKLDQSSHTSGTMIKNNAAGSHMMNSVLYKTAATAAAADQTNSEATMLGELADLVINSDSADGYGTVPGSGGVGGVVNVSGMTDSNSVAGASAASALDSSKTWNAKYTLRSHFDCVRALAFDYAQPVLVTGSDDCTLKLWNLQKSSSTKKFASLDIEPMYTFRNHTSPVLCVALDNDGFEDDREAFDRKLFSADLKGALYSWNLPNFAIDAYDSYQSNILDSSLIGHTDAIYSLVYYQSLLLSCSADKSLKLWSPKASKSNNSDPLKSSFVNSNENLTPTSADFLKLQSCQFAAGYDNGTVNVYDYETGKAVLNFDSVVSDADLSIGSYGSLIYSLVAHPTMSLIVTAHEDRNIRYWDYKSGTLVHSIVAHLDAVTCLTLDPNGQYLLSGSHDSSIRLWNLATKTCVQEITVHRMKCDESILNVAFHPSRQFIASAGADGIAKVFVSA